MIFTDTDDIHKRSIYLENRDLYDWQYFCHFIKEGLCFIEVYLYLSSEMRKWLKYLLPLIFVAVFWNCKDNLIPAAPEEFSATQAICEAVSDNIISSSESELCLPRQISYASSSRVQTTARRTTGYSRASVEFTKSGKIVNAGLRYFIQRKSIIIHSSLIEPSHKLLYLGKLII